MEAVYESVVELNLQNKRFENAYQDQHFSFTKPGLQSVFLAKNTDFLNIS